ncbi:hypothetical protein T492DRAFT_234286 [Pavlovales sp. CCMP2436]|nr:hypothetical protein T492DRAFT_234286 [Pavlovales sp. CCMP2436]
MTTHDAPPRSFNCDQGRRTSAKTCSAPPIKFSATFPSRSSMTTHDAPPRSFNCDQGRRTSAKLL